MTAEYAEFCQTMKSMEAKLVAAGIGHPMLPGVGTAAEPESHSYKGFRPLSDQVLVRPLPASDRLRSTDLMRIPGTHDRGRLDNRLGTVLALGPGDWVTPECDMCNGTGDCCEEHNCGICLGTGLLDAERTEFEVAVGDIVLYAPRGWAEIEVAGESVIVLHENQHVIGIVSPDAVLFTEDPTTKKKAPDWIR
jgi:co-chaperonin GroES (HSP10)